MERNRFVLAVMAAGEPRSYSPVQLQKLFFLMDREAATQVGGPYFNFKPYEYGPFDSDVYIEVEELAKEGSVAVDRSGFYRVYSLTLAGIEEGKAALGEIAQPGSEYAARAADWVCSLSFKQLVSQIYKHYPDMKESNVSKEP